MYSLWSLLISLSAVGLLLAVFCSFGLLALGGAIRVYSGLGHFSATRCFFGALTVIFLDIARIGLVVSLTVSLVTVVVAEGAISAGRSSDIPASKGLLGGDLMSGRGDGVLVSGGSVDSDSNRSVIDTFSVSGGVQVQGTIGWPWPLLPPPQGSFPLVEKAPACTSLQLLLMSCWFQGGQVHAQFRQRLLIAPLWLDCGESGSWQAQGRPPSRILGTCHLYQKELIYILFSVRKSTKL